MDVQLLPCKKMCCLLPPSLTVRTNYLRNLRIHATFVRKSLKFLKVGQIFGKMEKFYKEIHSRNSRIHATIKKWIVTFTQGIDIYGSQTLE